MLFMDEPTSGLDSITALNLGKLMKQLATGGRTVVATLHQPSSTLFKLFDNVLFSSFFLNFTYVPYR